MSKADEARRRATRQDCETLQVEAAEALLFTMVELGQQAVGFQLEFDGIVLPLVCQRVTQTEFAGILVAPRGVATGEARPAPPAP